MVFLAIAVAFSVGLLGIVISQATGGSEERSGPELSPACREWQGEVVRYYESNVQSGNVGLGRDWLWEFAVERYDGTPGHVVERPAACPPPARPNP